MLGLRLLLLLIRRGSGLARGLWPRAGGVLTTGSTIDTALDHLVVLLLRLLLLHQIAARGCTGRVCYHGILCGVKSGLAALNALSQGGWNIDHDCGLL